VVSGDQLFKGVGGVVFVLPEGQGDQEVEAVIEEGVGGEPLPTLPESSFVEGQGEQEDQ